MHHLCRSSSFLKLLIRKRKFQEPIMEMKRQQGSQSSLPDDVAFKIVSCLEVSDVCSLGSCSRFWREFCGSDYVWKFLCKERWPQLVSDKESSASVGENHGLDQQKGPNLKGWRAFYIKKHCEMAKKVADLGRCLSCEPVDSKDYLRAVEDLSLMRLGFKDVQVFFLKREINVMLNLVGLHYCIKRLFVQADSVTEAISSCKIHDRQVRVQWSNYGGWLHRFRLPDELYSHCVSLVNLTTSVGEEILEVLDHGVTPQVLQIQIYTDKPK